MSINSPQWTSGLISLDFLGGVLGSGCFHPITCSANQQYFPLFINTNVFDVLQKLKQQPTIIGASHRSGFHQIAPLEYRHYFVLPFCTCYCQIWSNFKKQSSISIIFLFIFSVIIAFKQIPGKYNIQDQVFKHSQLLFF